MTDIDHTKTLDKVRKLVTLAGRTDNVHERALAARKASEYLDAHPTPIRWLVPAGTRVKVVDSRFYANGDIVKGKTKDTTARGANWFFEAQRVRGDEAARTLALGWLLFKRHGKAVFVEAGKIEVHL